MNKRLRNRRKSSGRLTLTFPEAAELLGIGRNAAYDAAARGEIPTIRVGKLLLVPRALFDRIQAMTSAGHYNVPIMRRAPSCGPDTPARESAAEVAFMLGPCCWAAIGVAVASRQHHRRRAGCRQAREVSA